MHSDASLRVRNRSLPYKISSEDMYDIFGKYGAIRQIRLGNTGATRGSAFVVYEDIFQAKAACEGLNGFHVAGRYLIVRCYASIHSLSSLRVAIRDLTFLRVCFDARARRFCTISRAGCQRSRRAIERLLF